MKSRMAGLLLLGALAACAARAATSSFTVAYYNMTEGTDGEKPATFVASIDATPGLAAELAKARGASWREPAGDPASAISLVKIKTGQQCDFFAFRFADSAGTVAYAGRRPSRVRDVKYYYSVPPGPDQIPENAIRECATDFIFRHSNETARVRPLLQIAIEPWDEAAGAAPDAEAGSAPVRPEIAEVMAFAAAYEAGWRPTTAKADTAVRLAQREEMGLFYATRARTEAGAVLWTRRNIPKETIYANLVRLFYRLKNPALIREAAAFGSHAAEALAWTGGTVILADETGLKAVETASGRALWQVDVTEKEKPLYAVFPNPDDTFSLCRFDGPIVRFDPTSGARRVLASVGAASAGQFDVTPEGDVALSETGQLSVYRNNALVWTVGGMAPSAGPVWGGGRLFAMDGGGALVSLDPDAKRETWRIPLADPAGARLYFRGGLLLAATDRNVRAVDPVTGKLLWTYEAGDRLVSGPDVRDGRVTLAVKNNNLVVLNAGNGAVAASRPWPTWITGMRVFSAGGKAVVACTDLRQRLTVLKAGDLAVLAEVDFPRELKGAVLAGRAVPAAWKLAASAEAEDMASELATFSAGGEAALLCQDRDGFLYATPWPSWK